MDKQTHDQLKKQFEATKKLLESGLLSPEEKNKFNELNAQLAGAMLSSWLPADWIRRILMVIIFLVGFYGIFEISSYFLILLILSLLFSPRIVGEIAIFMGKIKGNK